MLIRRLYTRNFSQQNGEQSGRGCIDIGIIQKGLKRGNGKVGFGRMGIVAAPKFAAGGGKRAGGFTGMFGASSLTG